MPEVADRPCRTCHWLSHCRGALMGLDIEKGCLYEPSLWKPKKAYNRGLLRRK